MRSWIVPLSCLVLCLCVAGCRATGGASGPLDASTFVVLGEGLAAGMGDFALTQDVQSASYPAQVAKALGTGLEQPLVQAPGLGNAPGLAAAPPIVPELQQSTVLASFPAAGSNPGPSSLGNVAVPGATLADALSLKARSPLVHRGDAKQTVANFILGVPALLTGAEGPTQLEHALARKPTLALVELGYAEAVAAALAGDAAGLPAPAAFRADYARLVGDLAGAGATVVVQTVPDPLDTAYFSTLAAAAEILKTEPAFLQAQYGLAADDRITLPGLWEIGYQLAAHEIKKPLPAGSTLPAAAATGISNGVAALNREIAAVAGEKKAIVHDLHALLGRVAREGADAGGKRLSSRYLGGFYLLNGLYPGKTGHAVIAADLLEALGKDGAAVDVAAVAATDPTTMATLAPGPAFTQEYLKPWSPADLPPPPKIDPKPVPIQTTYPGLQPGKDACTPLQGFPACGVTDPKLTKALKLPPGREQTLPLNPAVSYFGDALRAVDCPDDKPFIPGFPAFGTCGNVLFGGLALTDSHVQGQVKITFSEPDAENVTRFEVSHPGGLMGGNGPLVAPKLFKLPSHLNMVFDVPGAVSSGALDLDTGIVTDLHYNVGFINTAILALFGANPKLPPTAMLFPGPPNGGSSAATFTQRPDGTLDFTVEGNLFLPLGLDVGGDTVRFPLPFCNPRLQCATVPTRGVSLHPHIHLTTRQSLGPACGANCPQVPTNTVREYVSFVHNTSFGDVFGLNIAELGGTGTGRAHLLGRLRVQFGERFGDTVPFAVSALPPGGLLDDSPKPLSYIPPGSSRAGVGFNEVLKFPKIPYPQSDLASVDDPFNISVGAIDLATGQVIGGFLHRGFVQQTLFEYLIKVEPCTPADSFCYRGPSSFERGAGDQTVFRFDGEVYIPYPEGFKFPSPDGAQGFTTLAGSRLDPFLRFQAMDAGGATGTVSGGADKAVSSIGQEFAYRFAIPCGAGGGDAAGAPSFTYENKTQGGTFELKTLSWAACTHSRGSRSATPDTVTFTGFGTWSGDAQGGLHQVAAQVSLAPGAPFVGIQVDGGTTSNVNTKPANIADTIP